MWESSRTDTDQLAKIPPPAEPRQTVSEKLFEAYLIAQGLQWEHEPPVGRKRPDYSIHRADQTTIIEVKEFSVPSKKPVGGFSTRPAIQRKLDEARPQLAEF